MNIILITPTPPDINAFGVRTISSVLKKEGFSTRTIFLPGGIERLRFDGNFIYRYSEKTLRQITAVCKDADIIGFSFMSQYLDRAAQITERLKKAYKTPVIWGGIHPTCRPEQCLNYSDIVCIGEGEYAIVELARKIAAGKDYTGTNGCWFKTDKGVRKNEAGTIVQSLDDLPFVDYDIEDHYVYNWRSEDILHIDDALMKEQFVRTPYFKNNRLITYRTMTSRGCPHRCSYCASSAMMQLRRRSVDNVIEELRQIMSRFNYIEIISFFDDTFFAAPVEYFEEFRDKYKNKIGLPFHAQCSPSTINKRKMELLTEAGLFCTEMGIQTGSERIKKIYRRVVSNEKIIDAAALIDSYRSRMLVPDYHIILDNPWETRDDVMDTLRLLLSLPGKFRLQISSLILFPGTELNEMARREGILKDELNEVCRKPFTYPKGTYLNYLIYLSGLPEVPRWVLKALASEKLVSLLHNKESGKLYDLFFVVTKKLEVIVKGLYAMLRGDFGRIINHFKLAR